MAALSAQLIDFSGVAPTMAAANTTDTAPTGPRIFALYKNTNAATRTLTITLPTGVTPFTQGSKDVRYTLAATTGELWIPLSPVYGAAGTGICTLTLSATTNVTVAIIDTNWSL